MLSQDNVTDPLRRLAMQLAIQLPTDAAEARQVLAMTTEALEDFLLAPSFAHRRARRLGWGLSLGHDAAVAAEIEAPPARAAAATARATLLALCSLLVTGPIGFLLLELCGIGAGVTFMVGVTLVALVLGTVPALALAVVTPLAHNLLLVPPALEFSAPTTAELVAAGGYMVLAVTVPWIAARRTTIRDAVIRSAPEAAAPATIRLVG